MKKVLSFLLTMAILVSMVTVAGAESAPVTVIDFEDGNMSFLGLDMTAGNADAAGLSVVDYNGSKALKVDVQGKVPYVALNLEGLLGENIVNVRKITFDVGVDLAPDGKFYAVSGNVLRYVGEENNKLSTAWSVYMKNKNPKTATVVIEDDEAFMAGVGNTIVLTKEKDTYTEEPKFKDEKPLNVYFDNIQFFDAEGNALAVDTSAVWAAADTGADLSNLWAVTGAVDFPGFTLEGGAWSQNGLDMPQEIIDALVPGSVVEIDYESESGNLWIVMPDSAAGWMRVADGGQSLCLDGKCYITYEQIAALCGEDKSTWGARMQCESDTAWAVYSVKVGTLKTMKPLTNLVAFDGFSCEAGAWAQNGFDMPQAIIDALVPGSVVTINYESESGNMWIVMPDSAAGWMRVADGGQSVVDGSTCQITYEQIAEKCGEDKSTWGARMQCESDTAWTVFSVSVGQTK